MTIIQYIALTTCALISLGCWAFITASIAGLNDYKDRRFDKARTNIDAVLDGKHRASRFARLLQRAAGLLTLAPLVALLWAALR